MKTASDVTPLDRAAILAVQADGAFQLGRPDEQAARQASEALVPSVVCQDGGNDMFTAPDDYRATNGCPAHQRRSRHEGQYQTG